ncbi:MAG: aminoacetone oxidase family FAD-binding enzyme, partial [Planctomycetota bacterium]
GGAAGLMTAASASRAGKQVLLLEKNSKLGVKILMSGGTRCNITHHCSPQQIVEAYGKPGRFLHSALSMLSPADVVAQIENAGVATKVEPGGKIFPQSDRAIDVRDALVRLASDIDFGGTATLLTKQACVEVEKVDEWFKVHTSENLFEGRSIVITTGGKSYPGCGTTGDGYSWAKQFGHEIVRPVAALTPITNRNHWTNELKGLTFDDVAVTVKELHPQSTKKHDHRRGGFLFTHFGFSGPAALDASRVVSQHQQPYKLTLECDFVADTHEERLRSKLQTALRTNSRQNLNNAISSWFPKRFIEAMLNNLQIPGSIKTSEVSKKHIQLITRFLKSSQFEIEGVYGFDKAEVTAGGVSLDEVDSRTMQ